MCLQSALTAWGYTIGYYLLLCVGSCIGISGNNVLAVETLLDSFLDRSRTSALHIEHAVADALNGLGYELAILADRTGHRPCGVDISSLGVCDSAGFTTPLIWSVWVSAAPLQSLSHLPAALPPLAPWEQGHELSFLTVEWDGSPTGPCGLGCGGRGKCQFTPPLTS